MLFRIAALVRKELQALLRDRQGRVLLVAPVLLQLAVFPFAATLEVTNNTLGVLNEDAGPESIEMIQRLSCAEAFSHVKLLRSEQEVRSSLDRQVALLVLRFPPDYSREIAAGRAVKVQVLLDGRRSNSGQIALGYVRDIFNQRTAASAQAPAIIVRHWFNPNLDYVRHIVPSLVAIITTISTLVVTALSVAREREQGTLDQLLVSPMTPAMIMVGKTVPALLVASFQATIILAAGVWVYRIPFQGSVALLYACMFVYILAVSGFGLLISSICATQQQAFLGVFSFMMPAILLSGFPSPVENMPKWMQYVDWFNPLQHFIVIVKAIFLKDASAAFVITNLWPLAVIALLTLTSAAWIFHRRVT
jgi:ABC-2 type transport system permease protein